MLSRLSSRIALHRLQRRPAARRWKRRCGLRHSGAAPCCVPVLPRWLAVPVFAGAQAFPSKPVKLVVPYPAGGFPDTVARVLAKALTEKWNQQVIIDNRPGRQRRRRGTDDQVRRQRRLPLLVTDGSMFTINPALYSKLEYDHKKDFVPVSALGKAPLFVTIHPSVPATRSPSSSPTSRPTPAR